MSDWPLLNLVLSLEGFDFAAFLLSAVVVVVSVGFAVDYALGRQGMGPYWNSFYATLGAYAGLCAHDWWLRPYGAYEPYLDDRPGRRRPARDGAQRRARSPLR